MVTPTRRKLPHSLIAFAMALTGTIASFSATTAHAAAQRNSYSAALAAPLSAPRREIIGGMLWKCEADRCTATGEGSRTVLLCQRVAKKFGTVARFTAPQGDISSDELNRCNSGT